MDLRGEVLCSEDKAGTAVLHIIPEQRTLSGSADFYNRMSEEDQPGSDVCRGEARVTFPPLPPPPEVFDCIKK